MFLDFSQTADLSDDHDVDYIFHREWWDTLLHGTRGTPARCAADNPGGHDREEDLLP